ncbi:hypothetical protein OUZ56_004498 [Daphnia magna]|uniref:Uncharacterized protein n=1 Tax=Daphnia magna TaxID=35525 RepID=A0ABQ9YPZ6_9CRUS|nr:hypothetical protein OUZ56_004498 [Daphnia magna]
MEWSLLLNSELKEVEPCCSNLNTILSSSHSQYSQRDVSVPPNHVSVDKLNHQANRIDGCYHLELLCQQLLTSPYSSQCTIHFPVLINSTQPSPNTELSEP